MIRYSFVTSASPAPIPLTTTSSLSFSCSSNLDFSSSSLLMSLKESASFPSSSVRFIFTGLIFRPCFNLFISRSIETIGLVKYRPAHTLIKLTVKISRATAPIPLCSILLIGANAVVFGCSMTSTQSRSSISAVTPSSSSPPDACFCQSLL